MMEAPKATKMEEKPLNVTLNAYTTGMLLSMTINWKIEYFSFRQHLTTSMQSPVIRSADIGMSSDIDGEWCLVMIPKIMSKRENEEKEKEFVSLHLRREASKQGDVPTRFWLRIMTNMNDEKSCVYRRDCGKPVLFAPKNQGSAMWGWDRYISHEDLFNAKNGYMVNDTLILQAEIQCLASTKSTEDFGVFPRILDVCTLAEDYTQMFINKECTDFVLVSTDKKEFPAHCCVLMARSAYFRAMISHDTKERAEKRCEIEELDGETLDVLLEYLYCGSTRRIKPVSLAQKLMAAADKLCISGLKVACEGYLMTVVNAQNASELVILADMHSATDLKAAAVRFISANLSDVLHCGGMQDVAQYKSDVVDEIISYAGNQKDKQTPSKTK